MLYFLFTCMMLWIPSQFIVQFWLFNFMWPYTYWVGAFKMPKVRPEGS